MRKFVPGLLLFTLGTSAGWFLHTPPRHPPTSADWSADFQLVRLDEKDEQITTLKPFRIVERGRSTVLNPTPPAGTRYRVYFPARNLSVYAVTASTPE